MSELRDPRTAPGGEMKGTSTQHRSHLRAANSKERGPLFDAVTALMCAINPASGERLGPAMMRCRQVELELKTAQAPLLLSEAMVVPGQKLVGALGGDMVAIARWSILGVVQSVAAALDTCADAAAVIGGGPAGLNARTTSMVELLRDIDAPEPRSIQ